MNLKLWTDSTIYEQIPSLCCMCDAVSDGDIVGIVLFSCMGLVVTIGCCCAAIGFCVERAGYEFARAPAPAPAQAVVAVIPPIVQLAAVHPEPVAYMQVQPPPTRNEVYHFFTDWKPCWAPFTNVQDAWIMHASALVSDQLFLCSHSMTLRRRIYVGWGSSSINV